MSRFATREAYNAYYREYMKRRYHQRRTEAIQTLGGECVKCGSKDDLEIDHRDASAKEMSFDRMTAVGRVRFLAELAKCQLLCRGCHQAKSIVDLGHVAAKGTHGTLSSRRYCKCRACKDALNTWMREWKAKKRTARQVAA